MLEACANLAKGAALFVAELFAQSLWQGADGAQASHLDAVGFQYAALT